MHSLLILLGACLALFHTASAQDKRVVYYSTVSQYRPVGGKFWPEDIDASKCTHMVYHKAVINNDCHLVHFEWNDDDLYLRFNLHKETNPGLRTLLAVQKTASSCEMDNKDDRMEFADQSITFLRENNFDGLVVDFDVAGIDYPNHAEDFSALLQEIQAAYVADTSGNETLLLVAAVSAIKDDVDMYYHMAEIGDACDWVSLKTYDFGGPNRWDAGVTYNHAGLHPRADQMDGDEYLNVEAATQYWIDGGVESSKLVMGVAALGIGFTLENGTCEDVGCASTGPSKAGDFTREDGVHSIYEACDMYQGSPTGWDDEQMVPYTFVDGEWISHDNATSLTLKAELSVTMGLGGWSLWSLDMDDFSGDYCGLGPYPMLSALNAVTNPNYVRPGPAILPADKN